MAAASPKYRPSLTIEQMESIVAHLPQSAPHRAAIVRTLQTLLFKANQNLVQPAFVTVEKPSIESSLGLVDSTYSTDSTGDSAGESLWNLYQNGANLSPSQKITAYGYAFNLDLLTPEQEVEYTSLLTS